MIEPPVSLMSTEASPSEHATISYGSVSWHFDLPANVKFFLGPAFNNFPSWLSQQAAIGDSLIETVEPVVLALAFMEHLVQLGSKPQHIAAVLQAFKEYFLGNDDIHVIASRLPAWVSANALKSYDIALNNAKRTIRSAKSALLEDAREGKANICAVFGGQGPSNAGCLHNLRELNATYELFLADLVSLAAHMVERLTARPEISPYYESQGLDLKQWLCDPNASPDSTYLASAPVSFPLIGLLGLCHYCIACMVTGENPEEMRKLLRGVTGHSQGVIVAAVVARSGSWKEFYQFAEFALEVLFWIGFESHHETPASSLSAAAIDDCKQMGEGQPTPMLRIHGLDRCAVSKLVDDPNLHLPAADQIHLALINSPDNMVVADPTRSLRGLCSMCVKSRPKRTLINRGCHSVNESL